MHNKLVAAAAYITLLSTGFHPTRWEIVIPALILTVLAIGHAANVEYPDHAE